MSGVEDNDALEALAATVQTWSDGYKFSLAVTLATINADTGNASKLVYSFGQGVQTATTQPTGAYAASLAASKDLSDITIAGMTDITDAANTKYGYTELLGGDDDTFVATNVLTMAAYMPTEADTPADDEETTTTGDRLNKG